MTSAIGLLVTKKLGDMEVTSTITVHFYDYSPFFHPLLNEHDVKTSFFSILKLGKKNSKNEKIDNLWIFFTIF
jgi:hypothetical protein